METNSSILNQILQNTIFAELDFTDEMLLETSPESFVIENYPSQIQESFKNINRLDKNLQKFYQAKLKFKNTNVTNVMDWCFDKAAFDVTGKIGLLDGYSVIAIRSFNNNFQFQPFQGLKQSIKAYLIEQQLYLSEENEFEEDGEEKTSQSSKPALSKEIEQEIDKLIARLPQFPSFQLNFDIYAFPIQEKSESKHVVAFLKIYTDFKINNKTITLSSELNSINTSFIRLKAEINKRHKGLSLHDITKAFFPSIDSYLMNVEGLNTAIEHVLLKELVINLDVNDKSVQYVNVIAGIDFTWKPFDWLQINDPELLVFTGFYPNTTFVTLRSQVKLLEKTFVCSISLPNSEVEVFLDSQLENNNIPLGEIIKTHAPNIGLGLDKMTCSNLRFVGNIKNNYYSLLFTLNDLLEFNIGNNKFKFKEVSTELMYSHGKFGFNFSTNISINDQATNSEKIHITIQRWPHSNDIEVKGGLDFMGESNGLSIADILNTFGYNPNFLTGENGYSLIDIKEIINDLKLIGFYFSYSSLQKQFELVADTNYGELFFKGEADPENSYSLVAGFLLEKREADSQTKRPAVKSITFPVGSAKIEFNKLLVIVANNDWKNFTIPQTLESISEIPALNLVKGITIKTQLDLINNSKGGEVQALQKVLGHSQLECDIFLNTKEQKLKTTLNKLEIQVNDTNKIQLSNVTFSLAHNEGFSARLEGDLHIFINENNYLFHGKLEISTIGLFVSVEYKNAIHFKIDTVDVTLTNLGVMGTILFTPPALGLGVTGKIKLNQATEIDLAAVVTFQPPSPVPNVAHLAIRIDNLTAENLFALWDKEKARTLPASIKSIHLHTLAFALTTIDSITLPNGKLYKRGFEATASLELGSFQTYLYFKLQQREMEACLYLSPIQAGNWFKLIGKSEGVYKVSTKTLSKKIPSDKQLNSEENISYVTGAEGKQMLPYNKETVLEILEDENKKVVKKISRTVSEVVREGGAFLEFKNNDGKIQLLGSLQLHLLGLEALVDVSYDGNSLDFSALLKISSIGEINLKCLAAKEIFYASAYFNFVLKADIDIPLINKTVSLNESLSFDLKFLAHALSKDEFTNITKLKNIPSYFRGKPKGIYFLIKSEIHICGYDISFDLYLSTEKLNQLPVVMIESVKNDAERIFYKLIEPIKVAGEIIDKIAGKTTEVIKDIFDDLASVYRWSPTELAFILGADPKTRDVGRDAFNQVFQYDFSVRMEYFGFYGQTRDAAPINIGIAIFPMLGVLDLLFPTNKFVPYGNLASGETFRKKNSLIILNLFQKTQHNYTNIDEQSLEGTTLSYTDMDMDKNNVCIAFNSLGNELVLRKLTAEYLNPLSEDVKTVFKYNLAHSPSITADKTKLYVLYVEKNTEKLMLGQFNATTLKELTPPKQVGNHTSSGSPAIAYSNGDLVIAWLSSGMEENGGYKINAAIITETDEEKITLGQHKVLDDTGIKGVALFKYVDKTIKNENNGAVFLTWIGPKMRKNNTVVGRDNLINVATLIDSHLFGKKTFKEYSDHVPTLVQTNKQLMIVWVNEYKDEHIEVGGVGPWQTGSKGYNYNAGNAITYASIVNESLENITTVPTTLIQLKGSPLIISRGKTTTFIGQKWD